jgi:hypothetical protein
MKMQPTRLIDGEGDAFELDLLSAARGDLPPEGAAARAIAAVGLATGTVSAAAGVAGATGVKASTSAVGASAIAKWLGVGAVMGMVASSGLRLATDPVLRAQVFGPPVAANARSSERVTAPVPPTVSRVAQAAPAERFADVPAKATAAPVSVREAPSKVALAMAKSTEVKPPGANPEGRAPVRSGARGDMNSASSVSPQVELAPPSIAAETQLIERARHALLSHQPSDALRTLDEYAAERRTGVLAAEAEVLRVEALLQAGQKDRALALAARALLNAPNGPHALRLREIVARGE